MQNKAPTQLALLGAWSNRDSTESEIRHDGSYTNAGRSEVEEVSELIIGMQAAIIDISARARDLFMNNDETADRALHLLEVMIDDPSVETRDALADIVDAFTGAADLRRLLVTVSSILHPDWITRRAGAQAEGGEA